MNPPLLRRLRDPAARGVLANSSTFATTLLVQLCSVPLFLGTVGVKAYAAWLVLTSITSYLTLTDLGFSGSAATAATQSLAAGDQASAHQVFDSAWRTASRISAIVIALAAFGGIAVLRKAPLQGLDFTAAATILVTQLLIVFCTVHLGFVEGAFRASGQYPRGILYLTAIRLAEFGGMALVIIVGTPRALPAASCAMLIARAVGLALMYSEARRRLHWMRPSATSAPSRKGVRSILLPSLTYAGFTLGAALYNQGFIVLVGAVVSPASLVAFATVRTLANMIQQVVVVICNGTLSELTRSLATGEVERAIKLQRVTIALCFGLGSLLGAGLIPFGPAIVSFWSHSEVHVGFLFVGMMVATVLADIQWRVDFNVLRAQNSHSRVSVYFLAGCALSLGAGLPLLVTCGILGAPIAMTLLDVLVTPSARKGARRALTLPRRV